MGAEAPDSAHIEADLTGQTVGRFRIVERIGGGGMGVVWLAEDTGAGHRVALKVLRAKYAADPALRKRFLREARHAAKLDHPNIAKVHEVGEANDQLFLVMEHVEGRNLRHVLQQRDFTVDHALDLMLPLARALAHAHRQGIVHRDLKPENVMVGDDDRPRLLDFGIAKLLMPDRTDEPPTTELRTVEGVVLGTTEYMSPEQAAGGAVDQRSDVFSFGIMLHEILAHGRPFQGSTPPELVMAIMRDDAPRIPNIGKPLQNVLDRCLAKRPEQRFRDAEELVANLERLDTPSQEASIATSIIPKQLPRSSRTRRWIVVALATLSIGAAVAAVVYFTRDRGRDALSSGALREHPIRHEPELLQRPALTADGKQLAYPIGSTIFIHRIGETAPARIELPGRDMDFVVVRPDGALLVTEHAPDGRGTLWSMSATGAHAERLVESVFAPVLSYDGKHVAYHGKRGIEVVDLESRARTLIVPTSSADMIDGIAWSVDGKRLAWVRAGTSVAGGAMLESATVSANAIVEAFTRGGDLVSNAGASVTFRGRDRLAFVRAGSTGGELWEYRLVDGRPAGDPRKVYAWNGLDVSGLTSNARGDRIGYRATAKTSDVAVVSTMRGQPLQHITSDDAIEGNAEWSRTGESLLFPSRRGDKTAIVEQRLGDPTPAVLVNDCARCEVVVGPEHVLVARPNPASEEWILHRLVEGTLTELGKFPLTRIMPFRCSRAGCWFGERRENKLVVKELGPDHRPRAATATFSLPFGVIFTVPSFSPAPDGKSFAIVVHGDALHVVTATGETRELLRIDGAIFQEVAWAPDGSRLFVTAMGVNRSNAVLLSVDLNGRYEILHEEAKNWITGPRASPDGTRVSLQIVRAPTTIGWLESR